MIRRNIQTTWKTEDGMYRQKHRCLWNKMKNCNMYYFRYRWETWKNVAKAIFKDLIFENWYTYKDTYSRIYVSPKQENARNLYWRIQQQRFWKPKSMISWYFVLFKIIRHMIHKSNTRAKNNQMEKKPQQWPFQFLRGLSVFNSPVNFYWL